MKKLIIITLCILFTLFNIYLLLEIKGIKESIKKDTSISEIEVLKEKVSDLEVKITDLETKNNELKNEIASLKDYDYTLNNRIDTLNYMVNNSNKEIAKINKWQEKFTEIFKYYVGMPNYSKYVYELDKFRLELKGE